ncbi:CHAT domain-containing protein [Nostoc sp. C110]|uniref:CHAT domain-containing protein n=1 Tax=Nostoc sp. C110 TaxID=3349876 RepID=UPI00370D99EF
MTDKKYVDFNLQLQRLNADTNKFEVAVLPSSEIEGTREPTSVSYDFDEFHYDLKDLEDKKINLGDLIGLGKKLADRLLPVGKVRELFQQAISKAGSDDGVRLRLWIRGHKLAQIPWEYSYLSLQTSQDDGEDRNNFLVLNPKVSLVRHESLEGEYPSLQAKTPNQLGLVMAFANVQDQKYRPLKLEKEKKGIEEALQEFEGKSVKLDWEASENSTFESLRSVLQKKKPDIFHFAGHGDFIEFDEGKGVGSIVLLENLETKASKLLPADALARELSAAGVRVAILGACRTGRRDGVSAWTGVAPALIKMGIPVVVAMQYEVKDGAAIAFSKWFYTSLVNGLSIDEAVAVARRAMLDASKDEDNLEWGVPVVYMRSRDSILILPVEGQLPSETANGLKLIAKADVKTIRGGVFTVMSVGQITQASVADALFKADIVENANVTVMRIDNVLQ